MNSIYIFALSITLNNPFLIQLKDTFERLFYTAEEVVQEFLFIVHGR